MIGLPLLALVALCGSPGEPAQADDGYRPPVALPFDLNLDNVTVGELGASPASAAILADHASKLAAAHFTGLLAGLTVPEIARIMPDLVPPGAIARIDAALGKLPRKDWPVQ